MSTATKIRMPLGPEMVAARRAGRKTQSRRPLTQRNSEVSARWDDLDLGLGHPYKFHSGSLDRHLRCPVKGPSDYSIGDELHRVWAKCKAGDILLLSEALERGEDGNAKYRIDGKPVLVDGVALAWRWKNRVLPAMSMPGEACRDRAKVMEVWPERVGDISIYNIVAEGIATNLRGQAAVDHLKDQWRELWQSIYGEAPGWVWAYRFEKFAGSGC